MAELKCWICGAVAEVVGHIASMESGQPVTTVVEWSALADHDHAVDPPTAEDLERAGSEALMKIYAEMLPRQSLAQKVYY